jgi:hypothetical protein
MYARLHTASVTGMLELVALQFGNGGSGTASSPVFGDRAFAVFRWKKTGEVGITTTRTHSLYMLIQYTADGNISGTEGPGAISNNPSPTTCMIGVAFAVGDNSGTDTSPWGGGTLADGTDVKSSPVWTGPSFMALYPRANAGDGTAPDKREMCSVIIHPGGVGAPATRAHMVFDEDNIAFFVSPDDNGMYDMAAFVRSSPRTAIASGLPVPAMTMLRQKFGLSQIPITNVGKNVNPSITIDGCDRPHIAYQSIRDNNWEIYYTSAIESGMPFRFDTRITESDSNSLNPTISVDNEGRRLIAWHDDRSGVYQIYAARSTSDINCNKGKCTREYLSLYGFDPIDSGLMSEYDPYIDDPYFANICVLNFIFKNEGSTTKKYHFRANFYSDSSFSSYYTDVDSRLNGANWSVDGKQIPFDGISIAPGHSVEVVYNVSDEDGVVGDIYYVEFEADDGTKITPLEETTIFFCPVKQTPKCVIPIVYTNNTGSNQTGVDFRVTVYRDEALTQAVLSANTTTSTTRWVSGSEPMSTSGIDVSKGQIVSVVYNPEFVDLEHANDRDTQINSLLCGVTYWIVAEAHDTGGWHVVDTYAIKCSGVSLATTPPSA